MVSVLFRICLSFLVIFSFIPTNSYPYTFDALNVGEGVIGVLMDKGGPSLLLSKGVDSGEVERLFFQLYGLDDPEKELWVNLQPGVGGRRLIGRWVGYTDVGRYLLEEDLRLKGDATRLIGEVLEDYGVDVGEIGLEMRFWIEGDGVKIREYRDGMVIDKARLRVRAEVRGSKDEKVKELSELIDKEVVPRLEEEVNRGDGYEVLRRLYRLYIVSRWLKEREGIGNRLVEKIAYYYGRMGSREWLLLDVVRRYLRMYEGEGTGIVGCVAGGVYLVTNQIKTISIKDRIENWMKRVGGVVKKGLFNKPFIMFLGGMMLLLQTTFGGVAWGERMPPFEVKGPEILYKKNFALLKENVSGIIENSFKGLGFSLLYKEWEERFSVIVQSKDEHNPPFSIMIKDIRWALILSCHPLYGEIFSDFLRNTQRCEIQQEITMEDVNWIWEFYRNVCSNSLLHNYYYLNYVALQRLLNALFRNRSFLKMVNQLRKNAAWGPEEWKIWGLYNFLDSKDFRFPSPPVTSEAIVKFMDNNAPVEKNLAQYKTLAKQLFYYWIYGELGDELLPLQANIAKAYIQLRGENKDIIAREINEKGVEGIFPGLFKLVEMGDPYATGIWINLVFELREMLPNYRFNYMSKISNPIWTLEDMGFYVVFPKVWENLNKLEDREKKDFIKFMWWFYFHLHRSFSRIDLRKRLFFELAKELKLNKYLEEITGIKDPLGNLDRLAIDYYRFYVEFGMKMQKWDKDKGIDMVSILKSVKSWEDHIRESKSPVFLQIINDRFLLGDSLHLKLIKPFILLRRFGFDVKFLKLMQLGSWVNLGILMNLSQDVWSKNRKEIEAFFSFFLFREDFYGVATYRTFNLFDLFSLYFSDNFQKEFGDIQDRQLKFSLLCAVMSQLLENGGYDREIGVLLDFNESQIKRAIKQVRKNLDKMKNKEIVLSKGRYNLIVLRDPNLPKVGEEEYENLLEPKSFAVFDNKNINPEQILKQIENTKGPLWLVIEVHGGVKVTKDKSLDFYLVFPAQKRHITIDEMVDALEGYAKNNGDDLSQMVIIAGNCHSGFWVKVLEKLKERSEIKGVPIVISGALPLSTQGYFSPEMYEMFPDYNYGSTLVNVAVQRFIEAMQREGKTSATLYELLKYLADRKFPFFPMIYLVEKKRGKDNVGLIIFSVLPPLLLWGAMRGREWKNGGLFEEFLDNIKESLEYGDGSKSLFVDWLLENRDELIKALEGFDDKGNAEEVSINDLKYIIDRIENIEKPLEGDEEEEIIQRVARIFEKDPERFISIVHNKVFGDIFETEEELKEKGGIEFSSAVF